MFEKLTGPRAYYVSNSGSDANDGQTPATAWATIQHAYNWCCDNLFLAGHSVKIHVADGTYAGLATGREIYGTDTAFGVTIEGRGAGTNVIPPQNSVYGFHIGLGDRAKTKLTIKDLRIEAPHGSAILAFGGEVNYGGIRFGRCVNWTTAAHDAELGQIGYCWAEGAPDAASTWQMTTGFACNTRGHNSSHGVALEVLGYLHATQGWLFAKDGGQGYWTPYSVYNPSLLSGKAAAVQQFGVIDGAPNWPGPVSTHPLGTIL